MHNLFIQSADLTDLVEWLGPNLSKLNWLFVAMDSIQDLSKPREFLSPLLKEQGIRFWWESEGLWLPGQEVLRPFVSSQIVVPFSAAFLFDAAFTRSKKPKLSTTTDQGEFTQEQMAQGCEEIKQLRAKAYVADGCGLQCLFEDRELYSDVQSRSQVGDKGFNR